MLGYLGVVSKRRIELKTPEITTLLRNSEEDVSIVDAQIALIHAARLVGAPDDSPVDVHLRDGVIAHIEPAASAPGAATALATEATPSGEVLNAEGAWLIPGLWDHHVHYGQWAQTFTTVNLAPATSAAECAQLLADRAHTDPPVAGGVVVGMNYQGVLWDPQPTLALLDEYTGDVPVVGISMDYHSAWMNTAALRLLGLPEREGTVQEAEWFDTVPRLEALPQRDPDAGMRQAMDDAASRGVVGIIDYDFSQAHLRWPERTGRGLDRLRVQAGFYPPELDGVIERGWRTGDRLDDTGLVTLGSLKIISDGSLNTATAYCFDPYPQGGHGVMSVPGEEITRLIGRAASHQLTAAVHAIGDHANALVLDAFAATGARGSVEHAQLIRDDDACRMAELGLAASIQPAHLLDDRKPAEALWPGRTPYAFATLHKAGVKLLLGSDAPVARLDPWLAMSAAVGRALPGEEAWEPGQCLTPATALSAATGGPVRVIPGMTADVALLAADPLAPGHDVAERLRQMEVRATILAGRVTYAAQ